MDLPLDGLTVLDVTQVVSGPFASMMLADLGAEVIKVERPDGGDIGRTNPPHVDGQSAYFAAVNRNKKSVALNLKEPKGQAAVLALAEEADVLVENHPPGRMERFGLDYESVREHNEELIYCSVSGFGREGPYRELTALDIVVQAMSGIMSVTGPTEGLPYRAGIPIGDIAGSMYAVQGILLALYDRAHGSGGGGEHVDVSMLDGAISWLTVRAGYTFGTGDPHPRTGNELTEYVPYGVFEAADAPLAIAVVADHQWARLCEAIDRPELAGHDRFATAPARRKNRDELETRLGDILAERDAAEWFERLATAGVPAAPIHDTASVWEDEHVATRELLAEIEDEPFEAIRYPVRFDGLGSSVRRGTPRLGEDTREALSRAGYDDEEIAEFEAAIREYDPGE